MSYIDNPFFKIIFIEKSGMVLIQIVLDIFVMDYFK